MKRVLIAIGVLVLGSALAPAQDWAAGDWRPRRAITSGSK